MILIARSLALIIIAMILSTLTTGSVVDGAEFDPVMFSFEGTEFNNVSIDPVELEKGAKYREHSLIRDGADTKDVDAWYERIKQPHSYPIRYTYMRKGDGVRKAIRAPAITVWISEFHEEFIRNGNNAFAVDHVHKGIVLTNRPSSVASVDSIIFDPVELLSSMVRRQNELLPATTTLNENRVWLTYKSTDPVHSIREFVADKRFDMIPVRTLLISPSNAYCNHVWMAKMSNFRSFGEVVLPTLFEVKYCMQINTKPSQSITLSHAKYLSPDFKPNICDDNFCTNEDSQKEWVLELKEVSFDALPDSVFWPEVPEGYRYLDDRKSIGAENAGKLSTASPDSVNWGIGPYIFEK